MRRQPSPSSRRIPSCRPSRRADAELDAVLTYGGGPPRRRLLSRNLAPGWLVPIYNALDPDTHHPVGPIPRIAADLAFLGNRLPDREARVEEFFLEPARDAAAIRASCWAAPAGTTSRCPPMSAGRPCLYRATTMPSTLSADAVLNINRDSMAARRLFTRRPAFSRRRARRAASSPMPGRASKVSGAGRRGPDGARTAPRSPAGCAALSPATGRGIGDGGPRPRARPTTPMSSARRRTDELSGGLLAASAARPRHDSCASSFSDCPSPPPGATGTPPPIGPDARLAPARSRGDCSSNATCPGTRRTATCREPRVLPPRALRSLERACSGAWPRRLLRADAVIVGSYVPEGVAVDRVCVRELANGVVAFYDIDTPVTLAKLARGDARVPDAGADPALRPLFLLHRRAERCAGSSADFGARKARALYCAVDPEHLPARAGAAALGSRLSRHLQRRSAAGARARC